MFLPVRVAPGVDTEFPYRVRIVDRGVDCHDPVCRHRFRFLDGSQGPLPTGFFEGRLYPCDPGELLDKWGAKQVLLKRVLSKNCQK